MERGGTFTQNVMNTRPQRQLFVMGETKLLVDILTLYGVVTTRLNKKTLFILVLVLTRKLVWF